MGRVGQARVADQLSWATSRRNLLGFYERLVGPASPHPSFREKQTRGVHR